LRQRAVDLQLVGADKAYVIGAGSSNGINCLRFLPGKERIAAAAALRTKLNISPRATVIGFVGRLTRDKGISELYGAYQSLKRSLPDLHLLLVGDFEEGDPVDAAIRGRLEGDPRVSIAGMVSDTAPYYLLMSVLALPTYREGLPNVALEAQASKVPVVTTTATGAKDSVLNGVTGLLVPPRDEMALAQALWEILSDSEKIRRMGEAGAEWVQAHFRQDVFWEALIADYHRMFRKTSLTR
jgi:glycosyltransferase involved in cell wall biosynthesis